MTGTAHERRWSLRRRRRAARVDGPDGVDAPVPLSDHPAREAARVVLPMLSGVADQLRWLTEEPRTDPTVRRELDATLTRVETLIQTVWTRAVCEPGGATPLEDDELAP